MMIYSVDVEIDYEATSKHWLFLCLDAARVKFDELRAVQHDGTRISIRESLAGSGVFAGNVLETSKK